jgi:putative sterol carrier protein
MATMNTIAEKMRERLMGSRFDGTVKFDCGADGVLVVNADRVSTEDAPADCTIKLAKDDFEALLAGDLTPTAAFMQGKIKVEGDMQVAMALSQFL